MERKETLTSIYKRVKTWPLLELKLVDCHSEDSELDFKFDKQIFKWVVSSIAEKKSFILNLYKVILWIVKKYTLNASNIIHADSGQV